MALLCDRQKIWRDRIWDFASGDEQVGHDNRVTTAVTMDGHCDPGRMQDIDLTKLPMGLWCLRSMQSLVVTDNRCILTDIGYY